MAFALLSLLAIQSQAEFETYPVTSGDKAFFHEIRKAILSNDTNWMSRSINYPITLKLNKRKICLKRAEDFEKHAALVFTSHFKSAVQNQSADALFKDWQGLMIANGDIWFSQVGLGGKTNFVWKYYIIGINLPKNSSQK